MRQYICVTSSKYLNRIKRKNRFIPLTSLLALSACGGGGSGGQATQPDRTTPPAPTPDFTESPTNTFTARDDNDRTLDQSGATTNLTVIGKEGNDTITTGTGHDIITGAGGHDTITSGAGHDIIWAGQGDDNISAGNGNDQIVIIGTSSDGQYSDINITNSANQGVDLSDIIDLNDINGITSSDISSGDTIDGGQGSDSIIIYGDVDLTGLDIQNIEEIWINSSVTISPAQWQDIHTFYGDGQSTITITGDVLSTYLSDYNFSGIDTLTIDGKAHIHISETDNLGDLPDITSTEYLTVQIDTDINQTGFTEILNHTNPNEVFLATDSQLHLTHSPQQPLFINGSGVLVLDFSMQHFPEAQSNIIISHNITLQDINGTILSASDMGLTVVDTISEGDSRIPTISITDISAPENQESALFTVMLDAVYHTPVTVDYTAADGSTGTLTFNPGEVIKTFGTTWTDDTTIDGDETITAILSNPNNATLSIDSATLTIIDDDLPKLSISDVTTPEYTETAVITITLSEASDQIITFDYTGPDGGVQTLTLAPGELEKTVTYNFTNDSLDEEDENLNISISNATNAFIETSTATLTIENDDFPPNIIADDVYIEEGATSAIVTVNLDKPSGKVITIDYHTPDGTEGTLTFAPNVTQQTLTVDVSTLTTLNNSVTFTNASNVYLVDNTVKIYIPDDQAPELLTFEVLSQEINVPADNGIQVSFSASDTQSLIQSVEVIFENEIGYQISKTIEYMPQATFTLDISSNYPSGIYTLSNVIVTDTSGKIKNYNTEELETLGVSTTVDVINDFDNPEGDTTAPELISFQIETDTINLDTQYGIDFTFELSDNADLPSLSINLMNDQGDFFYIQANASQGRVTFELPEDAPSGSYTIYDIHLSDTFYNTTYYSTEDLQNLGIDTTIIVSNTDAARPNDTTAPLLESFELLSSAVEINSNHNAIPFSISARDGDSGIKSITILLKEKDGYHSTLFATNITSGTSAIKIPTYFDSGTYLVETITIEDFAGNQTEYTTEQLQEIQPNLEFTIDNPLEDTISPTLNSFEILDSYIDFTAGESHLRIQYDASDDMSGVQQLNIFVKSIYGDHYFSINANAENGILEIPLDTNIPDGLYKISSITLSDGGHNLTENYVHNLDIDERSTFFVIDNGSPLEPNLNTTPSSTHRVLPVRLTDNPLTNGLLSNNKFALDPDGQTTTLTYSFAGPNSVFIGGYNFNTITVDDGTVTQMTVLQQNIIRDVLSSLSTFANINFVEVDDNQNSAGILRWAWSDDIDTSRASAFAYYPGGATQSGDMWFSSDIPSFKTNTNYFAHVVFHELGHALGLKHSFEESGLGERLTGDYNTTRYTVMAYDEEPTGQYQSDLDPTTFMYIDILALQHLYGAIETNLGNDTYTFNNSARYFMTIWDNGGNDTIDASGVTKDVNIDLTPDSWSDVGTSIRYYIPGTGDEYRDSNTVYIPPEVLIENAIGGAGDDFIKGNDADNRLNGHTGNDVLTGGLGDDIFDFDTNWGDDIIRDFEDGSDLIDLSDTGLNYNDLSITQDGDDTFISDGAGNSIILENFQKSLINEDDFIFS